MRDIITIWGRYLGRPYSTVDSNHGSGEQRGDAAENNRNNNSSSNRFMGRSYSIINNISERTNNINYGGGSKRSIFSGVYEKMTKSYVIMMFMGMSLLGTGLFINVADPYELIFNWKIKFVDGGEIFEMWRKPPVDIYLRVFLFNITNKDAFLRGEEKLKVEEVGPYVYKELMSHENVTFNANGTVSAVPYHPLEFFPDMSIGDPDQDILVLPHIALLSIADVVSESSYFTKLGLNLLIRQTKTYPLVEMTATEFMFGYESTLMTLGNKFLPGWVNFEKLGLIDRMYNFNGDFETVYTGEDDIAKTGLLDTYNGSPQMPQWDGKCGYVRGASDGTKFKSHIETNETLIFYRKSMCRPQDLVADNKTTSSGLEGLVYHFAPNAMDNGIVNEENSCYCKTDVCFRSGLLDVKECYYGFPITLSFPHFLDSDRSLANEVEGYTPDRQKHQSYFVIEPKSGLPLDLAVRFQINMALGKIGTIAHVSRFEDLVLPLLWTEIRMYNLPEDLSRRFKLYLTVLPVFNDTLMKMGFVIGTFLLFVALYVYLRKEKREKSSQQVSWLDEDVETECMDIKLTAYKPDRKNTIPDKELQVYYNSLVTPLNQDLDMDEEFEYRL